MEDGRAWSSIEVVDTLRIKYFYLTMKLTALLVYALSATAFAQNNSDITVITCKRIFERDPGTNFKLYKTPPKNEHEHQENILRGGLARLIHVPEEFTFVLNERDNRVEETDGTTRFGGARIEYSPTKITVSTEILEMVIDRYTGVMLWSAYLKNAERDAWEKKYGVAPPRYNPWYYQCKNKGREF